MNRPNILHIFVDQQRFDTIHALNNPIIKTPNLDRLVKNGVSFSNAYTTCPVCVAARCSMIYGQYPVNTGCYENTNMPEDRNSFMEELKQSGYITHGIGKCHFLPKADALKGFVDREHQEEYIPKDSKSEPYYEMLKKEKYDYVLEPNGSRGEMYYIPQISQLPERLHPTTWVADRSIEFIKNNKQTNKPWYLFSSFIHPHPPFTPPNPWHKLYRSTMMPLPNVPSDSDKLITFVNKVQNRYKYRDNGTDKNLLRTMKAYYYACISFVDYQIGKVLDYLADNNLTDNTMIVFTTDHGEHLGDYNCVGKRSFHDSAARIPMILSLKNRFSGGVVCDTPVNLVDLAPTFLNVANIVKHNMELDGVDLHDILTQKSDREVVFGEHSYELGNPIEEENPMPAEYNNDNELFRASKTTYMAVSKKWKYFYSAGDNREFLFDKISDPFETRNKANLTFTKNITSSMRNKVIEHLKSTNMTKGIENDSFKAFTPYKIPTDPDEGLLIQDLYARNERTTVDIRGYDR